MKVTGPGTGILPQGVDEAGPPGPSEDKVAGQSHAQGARFGDALGGTTEVEKPRGEVRAPSPQASLPSDLVGAIRADLSAGRLSPQQAVDRVIEGILDRQLGVGSTPAVREQVGTALREALENDPLLGQTWQALRSR